MKLDGGKDKSVSTYKISALSHMSKAQNEMTFIVIIVHKGFWVNINYVFLQSTCGYYAKRMSEKFC